MRTSCRRRRRHHHRKRRRLLCQNPYLGPIQAHGKSYKFIANRVACGFEESITYRHYVESKYQVASTSEFSAVTFTTGLGSVFLRFIDSHLFLCSTSMGRKAVVSIL